MYLTVTIPSSINTTLAGVAQSVERVALITAKRSTSRSWVRAPPSAIPIIQAHQSSCSFCLLPLGDHAVLLCFLLVVRMAFVAFACCSGIAYGADLHWSLLEQLSFGCFVLDGHRVLRGILVGIRVVFGLGTPYGWVFAHATIFVYTIFWHLDLSPAFVGDPMRPGLQWFNACDFNLHPHLPAWYTGKMTGVVALSYLGILMTIWHDGVIWDMRKRSRFRRCLVYFDVHV